MTAQNKMFRPVNYHHADSVDVIDILLRGQAVRQFLTQMIVQNPMIAASQPQSLRIQLGLEMMPQADIEYFIRTRGKTAS